jgi:hypothetical protein
MYAFALILFNGKTRARLFAFFHFSALIIHPCLSAASRMADNPKATLTSYVLRSLKNGKVHQESFSDCTIGRLILVRNNANIKKPVMPRISVVFYQEDAQTVPVLDWLDRLPAKAQDKCRVRIERLRDLGHELRRRKRITYRTAFTS